MLPPFYVEKLRMEVRKLRIDNSRLERSWKHQKEQAAILEKEAEDLRRKNRNLEKEIDKQKERMKKLTRERDAFKGIIFKSERKTLGSALTLRDTRRTVGGQKGHKGYGRTCPLKVDRKKRVYLLLCPGCNHPLKRASAFDSHTVTDIPHWTFMVPVSTRYEVERQWCSSCQKEVHGTPKGVVPGSRLGMNLITMVMSWRYQLREPFNKISELLLSHYGVKVSQGTLVDILAKTSKWLGNDYDKFLKEIRGSPVKHADETSYRVNGKNYWCWSFSTPKTILYTIEDTRGKGIPEEKLEGAKGVLVRDDYGAYEKLPLLQQSCWAHLLRKSHEAAIQKDASEEVKKLHRKLKGIFMALDEDLKGPFNQKRRERLYRYYLKDLNIIIMASFKHKDARDIQTRIKNQGKNLLTALLYEGVPLTNNDAERAIRKIVIIRKITGGSRTPKGADIQAVNQSIIETIRKRKQPLLSTLQEQLFTGVLGKTE